MYLIFISGTWDTCTSKVEYITIILNSCRFPVNFQYYTCFSRLSWKLWLWSDHVNEYVYKKPHMWLESSYQAADIDSYNCTCFPQRVSSVYKIVAAISVKCVYIKGWALYVIHVM